MVQYLSLQLQVWKVQIIFPIKCADGAQFCAGEVTWKWQYFNPEKWFKHAYEVGKGNGEKITMPFDSGVKTSIVDTIFARKFMCVTDWSRIQERVEFGDNAYMVVDWAKIKTTLDGSLIYY